ncbi:MAG: proline--tRNA ligase [Firmicutes bacterium HGW-Firmicutes-15]|nr:MAG: proline--tRNA ligase [Firmicutes bacterium HGW-Firmicutes-15]
MKASQLFYPTLREVPSEAEIASHQLLLRAGFIRKTSAGVYSYLPLAKRVLRKIENIIREEMDRAGGQELMMPIIQPQELWEKSGRWSVYGDEMFRLYDRHNRGFALGPTHEEIITTLVDADVQSYRDLPLLLYQIQNKYRDEIRPRFGLMRGREFIMKDLYSFDVDYEGLDVSYKKMHSAYRAIYDRMNLNYRVVEADSGAIGGNESHEFMVLADSGECTVIYCESCDYAANVEKAQCKAADDIKSKSDLMSIEKISTPGMKTVHDLVTLGISEQEVLKTLMYSADEEIIAVVLRGDRDLNEIKLKNFLGAEQLFMADEASVRERCGAGFGSLGPVGLKLKIYADLELTGMRNFSCGANEDNYHFTHVNMGRDFVPEAVIDLRNAVEGDLCPVCSASLKSIRGIEVGHIFKLGTKYSDAMGASFINANGEEKAMIMGCYGIGVSRTMAAAVEQNNDDNGIIWPIPIAPYHVIIVPVNTKKEEQMQAANSIYEELIADGIEVILDDRDERAGVKFKDADLIGIPIKITIGPKSLQEKQAEVKKRWEGETELVPLDQVVKTIKGIIAAGMKK